MTESHAVRAIRKKRQELAGELAQLEIHRKTLLNRLRDLDGALRVMGGGQSAPIPHGRKRRWLFRHGELQRLVCGVIRDAGGEIDNRSIARAIIAQMDWNADDDELVRVIAEKVREVRKRIAARPSKSG
jgi:hypothetical protein